MRDFALTILSKLQALNWSQIKSTKKLHKKIIQVTVFSTENLLCKWSYVTSPLSNHF